MRKEDWEDREEEIQRLSRNFDNRLAIQRQLLVEAHESEMEATQQVSSWDG
jgi:DNA-binding transcriptional regulator/RsmH inhibitor MraZ